MHWPYSNQWGGADYAVPDQDFEIPTALHSSHTLGRNVHWTYLLKGNVNTSSTKTQIPTTINLNYSLPQVLSGLNLHACMNLFFFILSMIKGLIIVGPAPIAPVPFWVPSEIDSWNFQHMLLFWFREASQNLSLFRQLFFIVSKGGPKEKCWKTNV